MNKILVSSLLFLLLFYCEALAWNDTVTHKDLSEYSAQVSSLRNCVSDIDVNCNILNKLGLPKGLEEVLQWNNEKKMIKEWLRVGAELEDAYTILDIPNNHARFNNHFHNPLKPWESAGLNDSVIIHASGKSSLLWAQDGIYQETFLEKDRSWKILQY